jgi:hypothetical protein
VRPCRFAARQRSLEERSYNQLPPPGFPKLDIIACDYLMLRLLMKTLAESGKMLSCSEGRI